MTDLRILSAMPITGSFEEYEHDRLGFLMRRMQEGHEIIRYDAQTYFINQPALIEQILTRTNHQFQIPPVPFRQSQHEDRIADWMKKRHSVAQGLHTTVVQSHIGQIVALAEDLLQHWQAGQTLHFHEQMKQLTGRITASYFFGQDAKEFASLGYAFTDVFFKVANSPFALPRWFPQPNVLRMHSLLAQLDRTIGQMIQAREHSPVIIPDLLATLMQASDGHGNSLPERLICEILVSLMIASHRSTAAALAWIWFLLAQNREAEQLLCQEVMTVLGERIPQSSDLPGLKYVECVVKEALRLYPPTWMVVRDVVADCEMHGYLFEKGQKVLSSTYVVQRNPRFFQEPERFLPERWLDETIVNSLPKYSYFPFGGGPRICLGASLALTELVLITAVIARRFSFSLLNSTSIKAVPQIILTPNRLDVLVAER